MVPDAAVSKATICTKNFLRQQKQFLVFLSIFFISLTNFSPCEFAVCKEPITNISLYHRAVNSCFSQIFSFLPSSQQGKRRAEGCTRSSTRQSLITLLVGQAQNFIMLTNLQIDGLETYLRNIKKTKPGLQ